MTRPPYEWTKHRYICQGCHRVTRVSKSALEQLLADLRAVGPEPDVNQVVADLMVCIACASGRQIEGEHVDEVASVH